MIENCDDRIETREAVVAKKSELVEALFEGYANEAWAAEELVRLLPRQLAWFDEAWVRTKLEELAKRSQNAEVSASALLKLAERLAASRSTAEDKARAVEVRARIERDYASTSAARSLLVEREASAYQVGGKPHDFEATDPDGAKFKLSDYRGKVVMLDFWGFW
jgi:hypothetical protein